MGFLQWADIADRPDYRAVFLIRHDVWRKWPNDLCLARSARPLPAFLRTGPWFEQLRSGPGRGRGIRDAYYQSNAGPLAPDFNTGLVGAKVGQCAQRQ